MHEMGIALQIIEIATASIPADAGPVRVEKINLKIGKLAAVVPDSLRFCFDVAVKDTPLDGARLAIEELPVVAALWKLFPAASWTLNPLKLPKRTTMFLDKLFKTRKYYHHDGSRHSHPHPHGRGEGMDIATQKSGTRKIKVVRRVLDVNEKMAEQNRKMFTEKGIFVLNVMSSPGSGKTTTLEKTLVRITPQIKSAVIVGDICTTNDADRLAVSGVPVVQINTDEFGGDCHLAAHVIEKAVGGLDLDDIDLLIVENVGNLVCPAEFDIGEDARVVVLSVTEGEDKPVKYPLMFRECEVALLNKIDLLPYLDYDKDQAVDFIHQVHPDMPIFEISAKTEEGFEPWLEWLVGKVKQKSRLVD
jgi:hydrogenase nickel incorporation protein HypB